MFDLRNIETLLKNKFSEHGLTCGVLATKSEKFYLIDIEIDLDFGLVKGSFTLEFPENRPKQIQYYLDYVISRLDEIVRDVVSQFMNMGL